MEWVMFLTSMIIMLKTNDTAKLLQPHNSNLTLAIPTFTVLLPTFLSFPLDVPAWLIPPHLVYMAIFVASITIDLHKKLKRPTENNEPKNRVNQQRERPLERGKVAPKRAGGNWGGCCIPYHSCRE
jgi:hypothetical protein